MKENFVQYFESNFTEVFSQGFKWQCWFKKWLGAEQATSHYMNQCRPSSLTHICGTRRRWVNQVWMNDSLSLPGKTFKCLHHFSVEKSWKMQINSVHQVLRCKIIRSVFSLRLNFYCTSEVSMNVNIWNETRLEWGKLTLARSPMWAHFDLG